MESLLSRSGKHETNESLCFVCYTKQRVSWEVRLSNSSVSHSSFLFHLILLSFIPFHFHGLAETILLLAGTSHDLLHGGFPGRTQTIPSAIGCESAGWTLFGFHTYQ